MNVIRWIIMYLLIGVEFSILLVFDGGIDSLKEKFRTFILMMLLWPLTYIFLLEYIAKEIFRKLKGE